MKLSREEPTYLLDAMLYACAILVPLLTHWAAGLRAAGIIA